MRRLSSLIAAVLSVLSTLALLVVDQGVASAQAQERSWRATGALNQARLSHRSVLLADARVLVTGGRTAAAALTSAELYNPITEVFTLTGSMATSRWSHIATYLPTVGKVLGRRWFHGLRPEQQRPGGHEYGRAVRPATGTWTPAAPMNRPRALHNEALLDDGRVLIAGGRTCTSPPPATCNFAVRSNEAEVYDPVTDTWTGISPMNAFRHTTTAAKLHDGRVLIPGGFSTPPPDANSTDRTADLFAVGTWHPTGLLAHGRARQGAMTLHDNRVLVGPGSRETVCGPPVCQNGGPPFSAVIQTTTEIYDPATNTWQLTPGNPLVPGGSTSSRPSCPTARLSWSEASADRTSPRPSPPPPRFSTR